MSLSWLAPIDTSFFTQNIADPSLPASNPNSAFYIPPPGTYQNDAGQIVPMSQPNVPVASTPTPTTAASSDSWLNYLRPDYVASKLAGKQTINYEDIVVIIVGLILIAAGLFAFKTTQTVIQTGTNIARRGREVGAAIAAAG